MVVVEVSGTSYLLSGICDGIPIYVCMLAFPRTTPGTWQSRPLNITKLRELGTALHTTSRGGWICYLAAFRNAVRFEIGVVAHVTEGDVRII